MRKSNFIVAAMAMAALVGCQKELAPVAGTEQAGNAGLDQRPVLASTTLTVGGQETRAFAGGTGGYNWNYEAGDQVGAVLVDEVKAEPQTGYLQGKNDSNTWSYAEYVSGTKKAVPDGAANSLLFTDTYVSSAGNAAQHTGEAFYGVKDEYIYSNYPYTTEDAKVFKTPATLVEGHYMFYAPYNAGNGTREALVATLPVKQNATAEAGAEVSHQAVEEFYKGTNPVVLALSYLSASKTSTVDIKPGHIFAYPEFSIENKFNGYLFDGTIGGKDNLYFLSTTNAKKTYTMKLKTIEFYTTDNDQQNQNLFAYKRTIKPTVLKTTSDWVGGNTYKTTSTNKVAVPTDAKFNFGDKDKVAAFEVGSNNIPLASPKNKEDQRIVVDLGGYELAYGAKYTFNVVMPAADYSKAGLYARILVEIDGKEYYIATNEVTNNKYNAKEKFACLGVSDQNADSPFYGYAYVDKTLGFGKVNDYQFADRHNRGSEDLTLVRGQRYPAAEINADKTAKGFTGELLKIELVGGMAQVALAAATDATPSTAGIHDNKEFIAFLNNVHESAAVIEVADAKDMDNTHFFLAEGNTVNIDDKVLYALSNSMPHGKLNLQTNLPIAANVVVSTEDYQKFTFTAGEVKYDITYDVTSFNNNAAALLAGINVIEGNATDVKVASGKSNAVVFLKDGGTVKTPAGINGIVVAATKDLIVNASTDVTAWVKADNVTIVKGGLVNNLNVLTTVNNTVLATINGKAETVKYTNYGFGTTAIPAASKVNYVIIDAAQNVDLTVDNAAIAYFANLEEVTVEFSDKIDCLVSSANVLLTNIVAVKSARTDKSLEWKTPSNQVAGVKIFYNDTEANKRQFFTNVIEVSTGGVTFTALK